MNENKNATDIDFYKDRSFKSCIADAWKAFALHPKAFLKYLWPSLLVSGVGFAILSFALLQFSNNCIVPVRLFLQAGIDPQQVYPLLWPSLDTWLWLLVGLFVAVTSYGFWMGCTVSQIRFLKATGSLPMKGWRTFRHEIYRDGGRSVLFALLMCLITLLITALFAFIGLKWTWWSLIAYVPLMVYLCITGIMASTYYLVERTPLLHAWSLAVRNGMKRFGGFFLIALLTFIPIAVVSMIVTLPSGILQLSYTAETASLLAGDTVNTPIYMPLLYLLTSTLATAFILFNYSLQFWAFAFRMAAGSQRPEATPQKD